MKHNSGLLFVLLMLTTMASCRKPMQKVAFQGEAQGTYYTITYFDDAGRNLQPQIDSLLRAFDQSLSLWVPQSLISRINDGDTLALADSLFSRVFRRSVEVGQLTGGAFDFTVGPLVKAWGFSFKGKMVLDSMKIDSLRQLVDFRAVSLIRGKVVFAIPGMQIDFNAIAQGYSVDVIGDFLLAAGIDNFLVDVGGEVLARGTKPGNQSWVVGIERPADSAAAVERKIETTLAVSNMAVATSGSYRKFYVTDGVRYSHTIDPATGYPVRHNTLSVTVVASDAMTADAMATAFQVMGSEKALDFIARHPEFQAWFIDAAPDGSFVNRWSAGMTQYMRSAEGM